MNPPNLNFSDFSRKMRQKVRHEMQKSLMKDSVATLPDNFYSEEFYAAMPFVWNKDPMRKRDGLMFIVSSVCQNLYVPNFSHSTYFQQPQALSSSLFKKVIGSDYSAYISTLVNNEVIEMVQYQQVNGSRKYILGERFRNRPFKNRPYNDKGIKRRMKKSYKEYLELAKKDYFSYAPLIYWSMDEGLTIDTEKAMAYYNNFLDKLLADVKKTEKEQ